MMRDTKIRWADDTWNPATGCTRVSPGCDHCYAELIATRFSAAFPNGFAPTFKPARINDPLRWRSPRRVFVNSMSDVHHEAFAVDEVDAVYDVMLAADHHDYQVLTKRPHRMRAHVARWLARHGLSEVPAHMWLGVSIESDRFTFRADVLRDIPAAIRFVSAEPLLGPLPSLHLSGLHWVIVGGESGAGYRPMDHAWARDLRDRCRAANVAFFFKQSAGARSETGVTLDGVLHEEFPRPHPRERACTS